MSCSHGWSFQSGSIERSPWSVSALVGPVEQFKLFGGFYLGTGTIFLTYLLQRNLRQHLFTTGYQSVLNEVHLALYWITCSFYLNLAGLAKIVPALLGRVEITDFAERFE